MAVFFCWNNWLYNLFHYKELQHNAEAYKKYNVNNPLIASISSKNFPDKESKAWPDVGDSAELAPIKKMFSQFPPSIQQGLADWS